MSGSPVRDPGGLTVKDGALIGAGMLTVSGAALFYKQKKTLPFKVAYFLSWPLLGAAVIQVFGARRKDLEQELSQDANYSREIIANRLAAESQLEQLRKVASQGK